MPYWNNRRDTTVYDDEAVQGRMLWLPRQRSDPTTSIIDISYDAYGTTLYKLVPDICFDHPVLVVSRRRIDDQIVECFGMTSFGSRSITTAFERRVYEDTDDVEDYLPLGTTPQVPRLRNDEMYQRLSFKTGHLMHRPSYVSVRKLILVPWRELAQYREKGVVVDLRLDKPSLERLLRLARQQAHYFPGKQYGRPISDLCRLHARCIPRVPQDFPQAQQQALAARFDLLPGGDGGEMLKPQRHLRPQAGLFEGSGEFVRRMWEWGVFAVQRTSRSLTQKLRATGRSLLALVRLAGWMVE